MSEFTVSASSPGVVYSKPSPEAEPFIQVGSTVAEGQTVCLIEVMKTFMEVKTEAAGTVTSIEFEDEQFVAEGDALVVITQG